MSYYAPFMQPINYYNPNIPNGVQVQNFPQQGQQQMNNQNVAQIPQNDNSMIWVLGKNEAESYPVAPNCQVVLWDKNAATIYVKSMSANGIPNMRTLDFKERTETAQNPPENGENNLNNSLSSKMILTLCVLNLRNYGRNIMNLNVCNAYNRKKNRTQK